MDKHEILKNLNEIQLDLNNVKNKLTNVLNQTIWDNSVSGELDDTITVSQKIKEHIIDLIEIQKKIILK